MRKILIVLLFCFRAPILAQSLPPDLTPTPVIEPPQYWTAAGVGWDHYSSPSAMGFASFGARIAPAVYSFSTLDMTSQRASIRTGFARLLAYRDGFALLGIGDAGMAAGGGEVGAAISGGVAIGYDVARWTRVPGTFAVLNVRVVKTGIDAVKPVFLLGIAKAW